MWQLHIHSGLKRHKLLELEIQSRMERGEIGISHGSDKVVGLLMFLLATFVTLLAMYFVFEINPAHYQL